VTAKPPGDFGDFGVTGFYGLVVNVEATTDAIDYRQAEPALQKPSDKNQVTKNQVPELVWTPNLRH
jgi:hypothetical protein